MNVVCTGMCAALPQPVRIFEGVSTGCQMEMMHIHLIVELIDEIIKISITS